ncbi:MAG: ABC transporter substrate-binding protein [Oscillospiraceae bacterium]|nr:ABC transporter substrate-binding protein [Oscillospiraceae bacterium]
MKKLTAIVLALIMVLLVGCGGTAEPNQEAPAQSGQAAETKTEAPASAESSRTDINLALNQVVETLNPYSTSSLIDYQVHYQIYEGMFFYTDAGEFLPRVCKDFTVDETGTKYTVTLNDGVKFHNGKDVTAEDVAWSLNFMARDGEYVARRSTVSFFADAVAVDDKTVEITTSEPSASFFAALCNNCAILCKEEFLAAESAGTLGIEWVPMGTGPYVITSYSPDTTIVMEAFPEYYRGEAAIKTVNYQILLDNNSTAIAFEAGDLDFISVPTAAWANISSNSAYNTYLSPTTHISFFMVNTNKGGPLANKLVRQALAYGMDREAMVYVAYDGIADAANSVFNPSTVFGGHSSEELEAAGIPTYEYNPEKAMELLAEAGYPNGVDIGSILCINGSYWEKMSTVFQDNMKDIGVTVAIELADSAACRSRRAEGDYDLATTGTSLVIEGSDIHRMARFVTEEDKANGNTTDLNLSDQELEDLLKKSMVTMDQAERRDVYKEVIRELNDEMYFLYTFHKATPYAYAGELTAENIFTGGYFVYDMAWN